MLESLLVDKTNYNYLSFSANFIIINFITMKLIYSEKTIIIL